MKRFLRGLCLAVLALMIPATLCLPVAAAEEDDTYGIAITLRFEESNLTERLPDDYRACAFLIRDSGGQYLVATVDGDTGAYRVTGRTDDEAAATRFRGGADHSNSAALRIRGLSEDSYTLQVCEIPENVRSALMGYSFDIRISQAGSLVDGTLADLEDGTLTFMIILSPDFTLPSMPVYTLDPLSVIALVWVCLTLLYLLIYLHRIRMTVRRKQQDPPA